MPPVIAGVNPNPIHRVFNTLVTAKTRVVRNESRATREHRHRKKLHLGPTFLRYKHHRYPLPLNPRSEYKSEPPYCGGVSRPLRKSTAVVVTSLKQRQRNEYLWHTLLVASPRSTLLIDASIATDFTAGAGLLATSFSMKRDNM